LFDGKIDHRIVVKRSTTPFCDAARALLAEGIDPATRIVMRHGNSPADALRSTVGVAAGLTVVDDRGGKPIFAKWSPYEARRSTVVSPPMRETGSAATPVPPEPGRVLRDLSVEIREDELLREIEALGASPAPEPVA
jgi:hypothetical protein